MGEEQDFVNRQPDGSYLLGVSGFGETMAVPPTTAPKTEDERDQEGKMDSCIAGWVRANDQKEVDMHYVDISRQYFTSGKNTKKHEEGMQNISLRYSCVY